jgi:4-carboxymuconolactone decarboxylase
MPETPTFGRYAEIPYDEMTPEQQEGYRFLVETRGAAGGPSKIWLHNPKLVKASSPLGAHFHPGGYSRARARNRRHHHQQQMAFGLPDRRA